MNYLATSEEILDALKGVFDPEIPVNIVDLGLVYDVKVNKGVAVITMTLTSQGCPLMESLDKEIREIVTSVPGINDVEINMVWDPPWSPARMSDAAKAELGMV